MASCEKCWSDAGGNAKRYDELIFERMEYPCTLEEQAGRDAFKCPYCNRYIVHQHTKKCINCGYKYV